MGEVAPFGVVAGALALGLAVVAGVARGLPSGEGVVDAVGAGGGHLEGEVEESVEESVALEEGAAQGAADEDIVRVGRDEVAVGVAVVVFLVDVLEASEEFGAPVVVELESDASVVDHGSVVVVVEVDFAVGVAVDGGDAAFAGSADVESVVDGAVLSEELESGG